MRKLAAVLLGLFLLGPPIPTLSRSLTAALTNPFDLSLDYIVHVSSWLVGAAAAALLVIDPFKKWSPLPFLTRSPMRWYALFCVLAAVSAAYSVAPIYTSFFALKLGVIVILTTFLATSAPGGPRDVLNVVFYASVAGWALLAVLYVAAPELVGSVALRTGYRLTGGFLGDYGAFALVSGIFLLSRFLYAPQGRFRRWTLVLYGLSWVFVTLSETRSTIAAGVVAATILVGLHDDRSKRVVVLLGSVVVCVMLVASGTVAGIVEFLTRGQDAEDLRALSGRADLFQFLVDRWRGSPWIGFGYGAGGRFHLLDYVQLTGLSLGAPHDVVSKVLIDLGAVGAFTLGTFFLALTRRAFQVVRRLRGDASYPLGVTSLALLAWLTVASMVSGGMAEPSVPLAAAAVCVQVLHVHPRRSAQTTRAVVASDTGPRGRATSRAPVGVGSGAEQ